MKYTKKDIHKGMKLKCIRKTLTSRWSIGSIYTTTKDKFGKIVLIDDWGTEWDANLIKDFLNDLGHVYFKEENKMQEFKVGDLVEVIKNSTYARNEFEEYYKKGEKAIVTGIGSQHIHIGDNMAGNLVKREDIKKVEKSPETTEHEEIVLRLTEKIKEKDMLERNMNNLMFEIQCREELVNKEEQEYEKVLKEIKEITKKLLTK